MDYQPSIPVKTQQIRLWLVYLPFFIPYVEGVSYKTYLRNHLYFEIPRGTAEPLWVAPTTSQGFGYCERYICIAV